MEIMCTTVKQICIFTVYYSVKLTELYTIPLQNMHLFNFQNFLLIETSESVQHNVLK